MKKESATSDTWVRQLRSLLRTRGRLTAQQRSLLQSRSLRWAEKWGWEENIQGLCITWKGRTPRLTFLVQSKVHAHRLTARQYIPELLRHREFGHEIATRVIECGDSFALQAPYPGTLRPGLAIGHEHGFPSGSLGLLVQAALPMPGPFILSCAHVMAWSRRGIFPLPLPGDVVEQPVSLDADPEEFRVGRLTGVFSDLTRQSVTQDFALAAVLPGIPFQRDPRITSISISPDIPRGTPVTMLGRVSGPAPGVVQGRQASVRVPSFGNVNFPFWVYNDLTLYSVRNATGDSGGSVVDSRTGQVVGIHTGGNGSMGLMYPIGPVAVSHRLVLA